MPPIQLNRSSHCPVFSFSRSKSGAPHFCAKKNRAANFGVVSKNIKGEFWRGVDSGVKNNVCAGKLNSRNNGKSTTVCCMGSHEYESAGIVKKLPIFPLGVVALPAATVPLQIFEARYRVLFNTLLSGAEGLEEELIQDDSPFKGTRCFGMCLMTNDGMSTVGTTLEIQQHLRMEDGRLLVTNRGVERFRILNVVQEKPVLICEVEVLSDVDEERQEIQELGEEVADLFRTVLRLNYKMKVDKAEVKDEQLEPEELSELSTKDLSYWIASLFADSTDQQQSLLEEPTVSGRLLREKDILNGTLKYLTAATALKSVFKSDDSTVDPDMPS